MANRGKVSKVEPPPKVSADDYERAEKAIFDAVGKLEEKFQHVVEDEVDTLFHELEHHEKEAIKEKVKSQVEKGAKKVKQKVEDHDHEKYKTLPSLHGLHQYPYDWPHEDTEHRLLHAVESAEKAVLHAVEEEVGTIFHELEHHDDKQAAKHAEKALKRGVKRASKHVEEKQEHRRNWFMTKPTGNPLEEYMRADVEPME